MGTNYKIDKLRLYSGGLPMVSLRKLCLNVVWYLKGHPQWLNPKPSIRLKSALKQTDWMIFYALLLPPFYYQIDDTKISAIGGDADNAALINTNKGNGFGFKIDPRYLVSDNLTVTAE